MKQLYLDMDGVLADFDKKKHAVFGFKSKLADQEMWKIIWDKFPNWFGDLEPMPDFEILWKYTKPLKPIILTAASRMNAYNAVKQKQQWIDTYLGPEVPVIVCMRSHKKDWASKESILIDDHQDNIDQFILRGGVGIYHKTAALSIAALEGYVEAYV